MTVDTAHRFTLSWTLEAPRAQVFRAWTDPDHLGWFLNPDQPPPPEPIEVDLRVGGTWRLLMAETAQKHYATGGVYRELVPDELLSFAWGAVGGWPALDPEHLEDSPVVTVTLAPLAGADGRADAHTAMVVDVDLPAHLSRAEVDEWLALGIREGMQQTVDRLVPAP